jgi:hypothetical protein
MRPAEPETTVHYQAEPGNEGIVRWLTPTRLAFGCITSSFGTRRASP